MSGRAPAAGLMAAILAATVAAMATCATGRLPPLPTPMANVNADGNFVFGMGELGCNVPQSEAECLKPENATFDPGEPTATVALKPFAIDVHEVTNEQYRYCVAAEICSLPAGDNGPNGINDYYTNEKYNNYPVVMVRWKQADEYCKYVGKRLPTEYEWEIAAGGLAKTVQEKRVYPWALPGYQPPMKSACDKDANIFRCNGGSQDARPVGTSKDDAVDIGGTKVYDFAGNVAEYTASDSKDKVTCDSANPDSNPYQCDDCLTCLATKKMSECDKTCQPCKCGKDSTATSKPNCYMPCQSPICARRLPDAAPIDGTYHGKNIEPKRMVRGGSFYNQGNIERYLQCDGRSDNRHLAALPTENPQTYIGIRCAKSL